MDDNHGFRSPQELKAALNEQLYIASDEIATILYLSQKLGKPLLAEGPAGVGKTELAKALAGASGRTLIRLQCYEGLDETKALYEWEYAKQLLYTQLLREKLQETLSDTASLKAAADRLAQEEDVFFSMRFLLQRPLLKAILSEEPTVLLIDEIDRADAEFEAFLLEVLSDFQVSVPELGTLSAVHRPLVLLTSNNTRELSEALKRRCLYLFIEYPDMEQELAVVRLKVPELAPRLARQAVELVQKLRGLDLRKSPSISETLDWAHTLVALNASQLDEQTLKSTLSVLLKHESDLQRARRQLFSPPAHSSDDRVSSQALVELAQKGTDMDQRIVQFIAALRASGVRVSLAESKDAFEAIQHMGVAERETFRISLRSSLIKNAKDLPQFEQLFPLFFHSGQPPAMMDATQGLSPQDAQKLAEALRQFNQQLRRMLEKLARGEQLSQQELDRLRQMVDLDEVTDPRYQNWMARQMEQALHYDEVRKAMEELMQLLQQMGVSRERVNALRQAMQANQQALHEQLRQYAGERIAENLSRQPRQEALDGLMNRPFHRLSEAEMQLLRHEVQRLAAALRTRLALRLKRAHTGKLDVKGTLRANLKYGNVPVELKHRDQNSQAQDRHPVRREHLHALLL